MLLQTSRFGVIDVDGERIIRFRDGLLGFPEHKRFALVQTSTEPVFYWLQSVDDPALAFVVCDPAAFVADYEVPVREDDVKTLEIEQPGDSQVFVIVNKVEEQLTANLLGPLLVGSRSLQGKQLVLSDRRYTTRHRLIPAPQTAERRMAKTA